MSTTSCTLRRIISSAAILAGLLGSSVAVLAVTTTARARAGAAPHVVYTVVELRRDLTRAPATWLERVVWVRARPVQTFAWTCHHDYLCVVRQPSLTDPAVDVADARLPLLAPAETPLVSLIRHVPLLAYWTQRSPALAWGHIALYHIRLTAPAACADPGCVAAQLVPAL